MNPNTLVRLRKRAGLTQAEVAAAVDYNSASAVTMWETGMRKVPSDKIPALASALGCTINELFEEGEG